MKNIFAISLFFFCTIFLNAQNKIKVGDKAPKINITDFIANVPDDKTLENKFIVLEF